MRFVHLLVEVPAQPGRDHRGGHRDAVLGVAVGQVGHGQRSGDQTLLVPAVHRVGARGERLAALAAVRGRAGVGPVHDVGRDGQHGLGVPGVAIGREGADLVHEHRHDPRGEVVHPRVVVAEGRVLAVEGEVGDQTGLVAHGMHARVLDRRQRVGHDRQPGDAARQGALGVVVVQGHLEALVGVLVVHEVDDVQGVDVDVGQPGHGRVEARPRRRRSPGCRRPRARPRSITCLPGDLVAAAVDRVEQGLGQVHPGAEELHPLADRHARHAAGDRAVVAALVELAQQVVGLVLDRRGVDGDLRAELLEPARAARATRARSGSAPGPGPGCTGSAGTGSDERVTSGRPS